MGSSFHGGEKQRLEIARSLYHNSDLILADEVKANLDKENARQISRILLRLPQALVEVIHHYDDEILAQYDQGSIYLMKIDKSERYDVLVPLSEIISFPIVSKFSGYFS